MNKTIPLGTSSIVVAVAGIIVMAILSLRPGDHTVINGIIGGIITLFVQNDVKTNLAAQQREGIAQQQVARNAQLDEKVTRLHDDVNGRLTQLITTSNAEQYAAGEKQGEVQGRANEVADNVRREEERQEESQS